MSTLIFFDIGILPILEAQIILFYNLFLTPD